MMLQKIIDGRTDRVFEYLGAGNAATSTDSNGTSLHAALCKASRPHD